MKKLFSSAISFVTSLALLSGAVIMPAFAETDVSTSIDLTGEEMYLGDIEGLELCLPETPDILLNYSEDSYNYKDFLDDNNIAVYEALSVLTTPSTSKITVNLPESVSVTLSSMPTSVNFTSEDSEKYQLAVFSSCKPAIDSLIFDVPEIFWLDLNNLGIAPGSSSVKSTGGRNPQYTITIKSLVFTPNYKSVFESLSDVNEYKEKLEQAVDNFPVEGDTRYEQIKSIHDYISAFTYYDTDAKFSDNALGSLVEPGVVCEGYSKGFKMICDRIGIPCILVFGNYNASTHVAHMWNYLKMEDGNWYAIDVTWDDLDGSGGNELKYDYFIKGSDNFNRNHTPTSDYNITYLNYPEISAKDYDPGTTTQTTTTVSATTTVITTTTESLPSTTETSVTNTSTTETTSVSYVITSTTTETAPDTASSASESTTTVTATTSDDVSVTATSTTLTTSSTATETTTIFTTSTTTEIPEPLIGDLNHDGKVNIADLVYCQNTVLKKIRPEYSCDCNGDGNTDAFDVIFMRKLIIKTL